MGRPQFITDNLANSSLPIAVFREMIGIINDDKVEKLREEQLSSLYKSLFELYNNVYHKYDFEELLFIARRVYEKSGVTESLKMLARFLNIDINVEVTDNFQLIIDIETKDEVFKESELALTQIMNLTRDLLFYASSSALSHQSPFDQTGEFAPVITISGLTYRVDLLNIVVKISNTSSQAIVDRYYEVNSTGKSMEMGSFIIINLDESGIESGSGVEL